MPFVCDVVNRCRDPYRRLEGLQRLGPLRLRPPEHRGPGLWRPLAHAAMPRVHRVASHLKRWILGTHQGSVTAEHLQSYLEKFTYSGCGGSSLALALVLLRPSGLYGPAFGCSNLLRADLSLKL